MTSDDASIPATRVVRRRSDWQVTRDRILVAARGCFTESGYRATTTKQLAQAADVAEVTLFRHFASKAAVFEAAAIEPINDFLRSWIESWSDSVSQDRNLESEGARFYSTLVEVVSQERRLLAALLATISDDDPGGPSISVESRRVMSELLDQLETVFRREGQRRGFQTNPRITPRLLVAMALTVVVHDDWLFGENRSPKLDDLANEMNKLTNYGLPGAPHSA